MALLSNFPLWAALLSIVIAQVIKVPIRLVATKEFLPGLAFSTGGMPSSHSAAVCALTTAIGLTEGIESSLFALAVLFSVITMFDASGVRRHAGEHAAVLNQLMKDIQMLVDHTKNWNDKEIKEKREELKELLGHQPIEVFFGALTGIIIALIIDPFFK